MKKVLPDKLELGRIVRGDYASTKASGPYGAFIIFGPCGQDLKIISSGACNESEGWEHVSISVRQRPPNWQEMCFVKDLYWEPEECVLQFHPPHSEYVNNHPFCLHLWKSPDVIKLPPRILVGIK